MSVVETRQRVTVMCVPLSWCRLEFCWETGDGKQVWVINTPPKHHRAWQTRARKEPMVGRTRMELGL